VKPPELTSRQFGELLVAASIGTTFEWYDFFLAATAAATVWPAIFFPARVDAAIALAVSIVTVGIGYLARPVGAAFFGHFGDRYGRRSTLVSTLLLMGASSLGTALLPPYAAIGILALAILFGLRFLMGFGLGGEAAGALSWVAEAKPESKHRGFWTTWPTAALNIGRLLAIFAFFVVAAEMPHAAYVNWGWRVPFIIGAILVVVAIIIRIKVMESPMFVQLQSKRAVLKNPVIDVIRHEGRKIFKLLWVDMHASVTPNLVIIPFSLTYLVKVVGVDDAFANLSITIGTGISIFFVLAGGYASDYVGRLKILRLGAILTGAMVVPFFFLLKTASPLLIILAQTLLYSSIAISAGSDKVLFTESFATKYRYSGSGLTYQLGQVISGIAVSVILPAFLLIYGIAGSWQPIACVAIAMAIISIAVSFFVKETATTTLE